MEWSAPAIVLELRPLGESGVVVTLLDERKAARQSYDGYVYYRGRFRDYYAN